MAPAWPELPPPLTFTSISKLVPVCVTSKGCRTIIRAVSRPKYSCKERLLIVMRPLPCFSQTRATDVFLRPVAINAFSAIDLVLLCLDRQRLGLLAVGGVLRVRINFEFGNELSAQAVFRQHSLDREPHQLLRFFRH